jgi:uncharacterized protein YpmB
MDKKNDNKNYQMIRNHWKDAIIVAGVSIGLITVLNYATMSDPASRDNKKYNSAISQYADLNQDNSISIAEKKEFDLRLIEGSGYKMMEKGVFIDPNGEKITRKNLEKLVSNYEDSLK